MAESYSIGQLADATDVKRSTLRYYERAGLLSPCGRTNGNYRIYSEDSLERVRFIRLAQASGFSLDDILMLLGIRDGMAKPCAEVEKIVDLRLKEVRKRIEDLRVMDKHLNGFLQLCGESGDKSRCEVLESLTLKSSNTIPSNALDTAGNSRSS